MITVKALENSSRASDYYKTADYYTKDDSIDSVNYWQGLGAINLGLKGEVDKNKFKELLDGKIDDIQLGRKAKNGIEHKPGWDLTFSVPKSVSLLALIGGDKRLITAVKSANDQAIAYIEKNCAITRQHKDGKVEYINEQNLTVASFLQTTSRELDPQLHIHNAVLNMTQDANGKWRSLESQQFYDCQKIFGMVGKSFLAKNIIDLGYEIDVDAKKGTFEISGIASHIIKAFSKRREQIEEAAKALGVIGTKAMERLNLITRKSKSQTSKENIISNWDKEAKELGFNSKTIIEQAKANISQIQERDKNNIADKYLTAEYTVEICAKSLFEMEAVCKRTDIFEKSLKLSLGHCTEAEIDKAIDEAIDEAICNKNFFRSMTSFYNGMTGELLTTKQAFKKEEYILNLMNQGKGTFRPIAQEKLINTVLENLTLENKSLNKDQETTVKHITTSCDQILAVQGYAGTGKTTMLRPATKIMQNQGYKIQLLGAYYSTAQNLQKELNMPAQTLSSFLYQTQKEIKSNTHYKARDQILILDEASQVNANDMADLLTLVRKTGSRLVLVGDKAQIGAVEWGKPFNLMIKNGIRYSEMKEIVRQTDPVLKEAVHSIINKEFKKSLNLLRKDVVENKDSYILVQSLVRDYFALSDPDRANSLIIIPDNATRDDVMGMVRTILIQKGEVSAAKAINTKIYNRAGLNRAEKSDARFYKPGQIVEFGKAYKSLHVGEKEKLMVLGTKPEQGLVILGRLKEDNVTIDNKKPSVTWNPEKVAGKAKYGVEVYDIKEREFNCGDKIIWTNTIKKEGLKNGDRGEIVDKVKKSLFIKFENGNTKWINTDKLKNFDYVYAVTAHIAQGMTYNRAFISAQSHQVNLVNQQSFYVSITRAREKSRLYTDDIDKLSKALLERTGEKTSSIEFSELVRQEKQKASFSVSKAKNAFAFTIEKTSSKFKQITQGKFGNTSGDSKKIFNQQEVKASTIKIKNTSKSLIDVKAVESLLKNDVVRVCKEILGEPKKKIGQNLYYGRNKGSLAVTISGQHSGKWTDFATNESGNLITLIQKQYNLGFKEALEVAARIVNYIPGETKASLSKKPEHQINNSLSEEQKLKIRKAIKLVNEAKDIQGTAAEKYLKETRGIKQDNWPCDIKYHEGVYSRYNKCKNPALLIIARDNNDKVQSVQVIYLNKDTGKKADVDVQKQTFGPIKGALFQANLGQSNNKIAVICEGPEDALSISKSIKNNDVYACFGKYNFNNLNLNKLNKYDKIILALDNDGKKPEEMPEILNIAAKLNNVGKEVVLVQPNRIKQDYNDILKAKGASEVAVLIANGKRFDDNKLNQDTEIKLAKEKIVEKEI